MNKRHGLTFRKSPDEKDLNFRTIPIRMEAAGVPATFDEESRSVEVCGATETPCEVFDYERWEIVNEILLMDGCEMPSSRQVPLHDSHDRRSTVSVLGSYREMKVSGGQLMGRAFFSKATEAEGPYLKLKEGHLTDFSVGYRVIASVWVPDGETAVVNGRSFAGPVKVTTRWRVKELSICPIGADELAKARSDAQPDKPVKKGNEAMNKKLRAYLESRGLATDASEDEAWEFFARMHSTVPRADQTQTTRTSSEHDNGDTPDLDAERAAAAKLERDRIREITDLGDHFECRELADELIENGTDLESARKAVLDHHIKANQERTGDIPGRTAVDVDERDKFRAAAGDALLIRGNIGVENPAVGAMDLTGYSLRELARHSLRIANQRDGGNVMEMVGRAMISSDFPYILANVANKSLFAGWDTAEETWNVWCGVGSVPDFKTNYLPRVSETDDLDEIPEHGEYKYGKRSEAQESYSIATYGKLFALTRQTIVNDDLNALTDIPKAHGEAAKRKIGDVAYAVLTGNAAMGDGTALFATGHSNYVSSGAAPGIATIAAGILAMGTQKDLAGKRRLNIRPVFFIAPKALQGPAEVFFLSNGFADSNTVATDSSLAATRVNPYAGNYFTRVYEARLDDNDAAAWYLAAMKGKTVTVFFLNGVQQPYMETKNGWTVDGVEYKVRIDCGAKAVDWKGLYLNMGD